MDQLPRGANQFVDNLNDVHRQADGARLVRNGAGDCLANPPRSIGGKFVSAAILELVHRLHQAHVSFLDQIEELEAAVGVLLGHRHNKPQVGFNELVFGLFRVHLALDHLALGVVQLLERRVGIFFQPFHVGAKLPLCRTGVLFEFFTAYASHLLFQAIYLAVERAQDVDSFVKPIDQAFALEVAQAEVTNDERAPHDLAGQG